jgi:hypothetical protein
VSQLARTITIVHKRNECPRALLDTVHAHVGQAACCSGLHGRSSRLTIAIPDAPFIGLFGFVQLPGTLLIPVIAITPLYGAAAEMTKRRFYRGVP